MDKKMYWLIIPVATALIKQHVSKTLSDARSDGVETAKTKALSTIYKGLYGTFSNISINIVLLLIAVYFFPLFLKRETSIFFIANVYLASIIQGAYNTLPKIPIVYEIVFKYHLNFKSYIRDQIYSEAYKEAQHKAKNVFFIFKPIVFVFAGTSNEIADNMAKGISMKAAEIIFHEILKKILIIAICVFTYFALFRYVVAPFLLHDVTGMSVFDTLLYPFIFSVKYFTS
jgi:hypothetical protein